MNRRLAIRRLLLAGFSPLGTIGLLPLHAQSPDDARAAIELLLKQQETAWNQGDGAGFAAAFTNDADFVNIRGDVVHGQQMIAARHAFILATRFKGRHVAITVRQFTDIAPGNRGRRNRSHPDRISFAPTGYRAGLSGRTQDPNEIHRH